MFLTREHRHIEEDDRRFHRKLHMEEAVIQKLTVGDRLIAQRSRAHERNDVLGVSSVDNRIAKLRETRRLPRHRAKARKVAIKQWHRDYAFKNRNPDPPSYHEGAGLV